MNPFIVTGKIDPAYFCDREEESARLIRSLDNGNNLVIISPRRMGKTVSYTHLDVYKRQCTDRSVVGLFTAEWAFLSLIARFLF